VKRAPRPRATSALAIVPAAVTDRTAPAVLGLEPRAYRRLVERERIPHAVVARRVVCRVDDVLAALDRVARRTGDTEVVDPAADDLDDQPQSADEVLRRLGKERVA